MTAEQVEVGIAAIRATLGGGLRDFAAYVSCPIMSGKRSITNPNECEQLNREAAILAGIRLRNHHGMHKLIEPARFTNIHGWQFDDYMALWFSVLSSVCESAIFVDGWEYSGGCVLEYLHCCRCGIPTLNEMLESITIDQAIIMITNACLEFRRLGHNPSPRLIDTVESLKALTVKQ